MTDRQAKFFSLYYQRMLRGMELDAEIFCIRNSISPEFEKAVQRVFIEGFKAGCKASTGKIGNPVKPMFP